MATATKEKSATSGTSATTETAPKVVRQSAVIEIDVTSALPLTSFAPVTGTKRGAWDSKLDQVYTMTEQGEIPRDDDGKLQFVKIGQYRNPQGVSAQIKAFRKRELDKTYEFRGISGALYVRVIEADDA